MADQPVPPGEPTGLPTQHTERGSRWRLVTIKSVALPVTRVREPDDGSQTRCLPAVGRAGQFVRADERLAVARRVNEGQHLLPVGVPERVAAVLAL